MFLALNVQYATMRKEYNKCIYEQDSISRSLEKVTHQMGLIEQAAGDSTSYKSSDTYKQLQAYSTTCESRKDFLDSKISFLKGQIDSYKGVIGENIKNDSNIWCWA